MDGSANLEESILDHWPGYNGERPVRVGNAAAQHCQHDIFGEMVLALTPIFLDERMSASVSPAALRTDRRIRAKGHLAGGTARRGDLGVPHRMEPADLFQLDVLGGGGSDGED